MRRLLDVLLNIRIFRVAKFLRLVYQYINIRMNHELGFQVILLIKSQFSIFFSRESNKKKKKTKIQKCEWISLISYSIRFFYNSMHELIVEIANQESTMEFVSFNESTCLFARQKNRRFILVSNGSLADVVGTSCELRKYLEGLLRGNWNASWFFTFFMLDRQKVHTGRGLEESYPGVGCFKQGWSIWPVEWTEIVNQVDSWLALFLIQVKWALNGSCCVTSY